MAIKEAPSPNPTSPTPLPPGRDGAGSSEAEAAEISGSTIPEEVTLGHTGSPLAKRGAEPRGPGRRPLQGSSAFPSPTFPPFQLPGWETQLVEDILLLSSWDL